MTKPLTIKNLDQFKATPVDAGYPSSSRTFYAPYDDVHGALKTILSSATKSVVISMFGFDDLELATIIAGQLNNPALFVQITLDLGQTQSAPETSILAQFKAEYASNSVAMGTSEHGALIHRKMMIIDGLWRVSGSTNWSASGEKLQDNELTVVKNAIVAAEARHFLDLSHTKALTDMAKRNTPK